MFPKNGMDWGKIEDFSVDWDVYWLRMGLSLAGLWIAVVP